jgi:hypothetical protein
MTINGTLVPDTAAIPTSVTTHGWRRWESLTGIGFVAFFIASVGASNPPAPSASDQAWVANYAGRSHEVRHLITGICLVIAALCLMSFLTMLWTRIAAARRPARLSSLPLAAAGVSAACIAVGGVLMGGMSGSMLFASAPEPSAQILRLGNDVGFAMVGLPGMLAAALCVACLSVSGHAVGLFGRGMSIFGLVVAVVLLAALAFVPVFAFLIWMVVAAVMVMRNGAATGLNATASDQASSGVSSSSR